MTVPAYMDMREGHSTITRYAEGIESGNGVVVATRELGGLLDADTCLALERDSTILRSGTLSRARLVTLQSAPGLSLQVAAYGGNYLQVVDPSFRGSFGDIAMGAAGAKELGLSREGLADISGVGLVTISAIVDGNSRVPAQGRWIYEPDYSADGAEECWIEASPGVRGPVIDVLRARFEHVGDLRVTTLVAADSQDAFSNWSSRATRQAWVPFAFTATLLYFLVSLPRRSEIGLRLSLGASRAIVLLQLFIENFVLLSLVAASGVLWLSLAETSMGGERLVLILGLVAFLKVACMHLMLASLTGLWLVSRSIYSSLRSK
jgi:hypothetical protein